MSNMCTCHINPKDCDWCHLQWVKENFGVYDDVIWLAEKLEEYMLKEAAPEVVAPPTLAQFTAVDFLDKLDNWGKNCGSCKYFDTKENRCNKRNIFVKHQSPKCPDWRYIG